MERLGREERQDAQPGEARPHDAYAKRHWRAGLALASAGQGPEGRRGRSAQECL